jgi:hypothetical protein
MQVSYLLKPQQLPQMAWRTATCWLRRVPEVHIVGCLKCGTTALNEYLQQHPGVASSGEQFVKEVRSRVRAAPPLIFQPSPGRPPRRVVVRR